MLTGESRFTATPTSSIRCRPGDALFFDAGAPHGPEELLERPMTYLSIIIYPRS